MRESREREKNMRNEISKSGKKNRAKERGRKKTRIKQIQREKNTTKEIKTDRKRYMAQRDSLSCVPAAFQFPFKLLYFFLLLQGLISLSLSVSQRLSVPVNISLPFTLIIKHLSFATPKIHLSTDRRRNREMKANNKRLFFNSLWLQSLLNWHDSDAFVKYR